MYFKIRRENYRQIPVPMLLFEVCHDMKQVFFFEAKVRSEIYIIHTYKAPPQRLRSQNPYRDEILEFQKIPTCQPEYRKSHVKKSPRRSQHSQLEEIVERYVFLLTAKKKNPQTVSNTKIQRCMGISTQSLVITKFAKSLSFLFLTKQS